MKKCTIFMMVFILILILSLGCNVTVAYEYEYSDNKIVDFDGKSIELKNPSDDYVERLGRKIHKM